MTFSLRSVNNILADDTFLSLAKQLFMIYSKGLTLKKRKRQTFLSYSNSPPPSPPPLVVLQNYLSFFRCFYGKNIGVGIKEGKTIFSMEGFSNDHKFLVPNMLYCIFMIYCVNYSIMFRTINHGE